MRKEKGQMDGPTEAEINTYLSGAVNLGLGVATNTTVVTAESNGVLMIDHTNKSQ
jgi:hypothetical protein